MSIPAGFHLTRHALFVGTVLLCAGLSAAAQTPGKYEASLGPTPITGVTRNITLGEGYATATLAGDKLNVTATFDGLATPATDAHLMLGSGIGIPGNPVLPLTVSPGTSGTLTGSLSLSRAQVAALKSGKLYIQINSQKLPAPGGNLWGWLLPEHEKAGQDEPQIGHWYLPQGEGLKAHPTPGNRPS